MDNYTENNEEGQHFDDEELKENEDVVFPYEAIKHPIFNPTEQRQNQVDELRSKVNALEWNSPTGRNKKKILQAHITKYGSLKIGVKCWHFSIRDMEELCGVPRKSIVKLVPILVAEGWLKREIPRGDVPNRAFTFAFGYKMRNLLGGDYEPCTIADIPGQCNHIQHNIAKAKGIRGSVEFVIIALQNGHKTLAAIEAYTGLHRTTVKKVVKNMELYSIAFLDENTKEVVLNWTNTLKQIAEDKGTIYWLEDKKRQHEEERADFLTVYEQNIEHCRFLNGHYEV